MKVFTFLISFRFIDLFTNLDCKFKTSRNICYRSFQNDSFNFLSKWFLCFELFTVFNFSFSENADDSPQRMRTRNKTKEQTTNNRSGNGNRPKRGGTETPEPKPPKQPNAPSTPDKLSSTQTGIQTNNNTTPSKKNKALTNTKSSELKSDTPHKRKRQDGKYIFLIFFFINGKLNIKSLTFFANNEINFNN